MNINDFPEPHIPPKLPISEIIACLLADFEFLKICFNASSKLSEFIGYLQNLPNPSISFSLNVTGISSFFENRGHVGNH